MITRRDLENGYQATQGMHAAFAFAMQHPDELKDWYENSEYLSFLAAKNEYELLCLFEKSQSFGIKCSLFREPDIGNQVTAIALESCEKARKLCGSLPLALKKH